MSSLFALFLVTSLANILTPGLGVVMIITLAAEYGWRRTMSGALGTALGIAFLFIAGMSGVGVIVASSPMLFAAIKLLGACFLIWLSMKEAPERMRVLFLFSLCSMLRPAENASLEKSWVTEDAIHIPAEHMKKRKPFRLPLTGFMRELLEREAALSPHPRCAFVFAARVTGRHISAQTLAKHLHSTP